MARKIDRKLVLADGSEYLGYGFGARVDAVTELVFNASVVGYQEILSDPSYTGQTVVMTYPLIGNYGIADEDFETKTPTLGGFVVSEYNDFPSNFRYTKTLAEVMEEYQIPGIEGIDTRKLARHIRDNGTCRALITSPEVPTEEALARIAEATPDADAVAKVSCRKRWYSRTPNHKFNVVALDCGIKLNIVRMLNARGCNVTVVPYNTSAAEIAAIQPDGLLLSNGPGDPKNVPTAVALVRELRGKCPIFGIGLGHEIVALAYGGDTYKMKCGHHGGYSVRDLETGLVEVTSQGHDYAVDPESLGGTKLTVTHVNIADGTVEGISCEEDRVFSVQYQPESAPGPQDSAHLFDRFISHMKEAKANA